MRIDDAALIEQSRRRPDAFAVLYDRYFGDVYRYVAGRVGAQVADDLAAETFLVAYDKRRSYDPGRGAGGLALRAGRTASRRRPEDRVRAGGDVASGARVGLPAARVHAGVARRG
ncbi:MULTISPECIES: sigma factor [unclassified Nonomuraea]|uniref:RNA polymerase sigma factor n=1 Tax=unclassified Nonomuraea TaxID=2593643 RepID=UPI0033F276BA